METEKFESNLEESQAENPEETKQGGEELSSEQRLAESLRERIMSEDFGVPDSITEQQNEKLKKDIDDVVDIFGSRGRPWFLGGGIALELRGGDFRRPHEDFDIFVHKEDVHGFIDPIRKAGYEIFHVEPGEEDSIATEEQIIAENNFHVKKIDVHMPGPPYIDLQVAQEEELAADIRDFRNIFENAATYALDNGKEVPLEPREVGVLNKVLGGRQLDFHDLKEFLPSLTAEERQRVNEYLEANDVTFVVGDTETKDPDELLEIAESSTKGVKEDFVAANVETRIERYRERFDFDVEKIYSAVRRNSTASDYQEEIQKEYGSIYEILSREEKEILDKMGRFLVENRALSKEEFREYAYETFFKEFLADQLRVVFMLAPRWEVKQNKL